ncbi:MAG: site-specific integrase [Lachnospiraceae bacterium]|nr:site-specific integrase [Lachnospiraceae bacterium]MBQ9741339.1 site-specific integrase [Kiritimatiellia bacterium]
MATAKKLPSGSWRCQVFAGYEIRDGKKKAVYKSFTVKDPSKRGKKECERLAAAWALDHEDRGDNITVFDAVRKYIDTKEKALSPSTVRGYENYLKKRIVPIQSVMLPDLTQAMVQEWVNSLSEDCSEKYIKNVLGLFNSAVAYHGGHTFEVNVPSSAKPALHTPHDEEIRILLDHIKDRPELLAAVLLAAFGSMRRGEICALLPSDFSGSRVRVSKSMVMDKDGYWVIKPTPKTDESNRTVVLPDFVVRQIVIPAKGRVVPLHPEQVSNRFRRAVRSSGVETRFRFHDLRHYYVSIAHALGVPDAYIMQMGGWKTDNVMHRVYRDTLPDVMAAEQEKMTEHFRDIFGA